MTRINTNVSSLTAQLNLSRTNDQMQTALTRLSTGLRINTGKDDPAGLIASEALGSDITSVGKAISNSERANQVIATADSALGQVSSLLNDIRGLVTEAANSGAMSDDQITANQLQVDSSLEAIDRIAQTTSFQGRRLLDGSLDFQTTYTAGATTVEDMKIDQANLGAAGTMDVDVVISAAATQASVDSGAVKAGALKYDTVFQLTGSKGSQVFNFAADTTVAQIADAINLVTDATGVTADNTTNANLTLIADTYGSNVAVTLKVISQGTVAGAGLAVVADGTDAGSDIAATVNGYNALGNGNTLSINTPTLAMTATVDDGSSTAVSFSIDGGGALFQLGPDVVSNQQARIGIQAMNSATLGGPTGRLYQLGSGQDAALATDATTAAAIADEVISKVTGVRGRLGAFQKTTLASNISSLNDTLQNLTAARSTIRDADFAAESANLTRAQILQQSGMQVLSLANKAPEAVLSLLR